MSNIVILCYLLIIIIIIIIMGLRSVSASKDVIGDPSRPGTNNSELLEPRREEREKVLGKPASFHFNRAGKEGSLWREKMCFYAREKCG